MPEKSTHRPVRSKLPTKIKRPVTGLGKLKGPKKANGKRTAGTTKHSGKALLTALTPPPVAHRETALDALLHRAQSTLDPDVLMSMVTAKLETGDDEAANQLLVNASDGAIEGIVALQGIDDDTDTFLAKLKANDEGVFDGMDRLRTAGAEF